MPVLGRVAAIGRPAGDIDQPPAGAQRSPVQHRPAREVGGGLQIDLQRARPGRAPGLGVGFHGHRLEHSGVVDQHVDAAVQAIQRPLPQPVARPGVFEFLAQRRGRILAAVADHPGAAGAERIEDRRPDAAAGPGDQDVWGWLRHAGSLAAPAAPRQGSPLAIIRPS